MSADKKIKSPGRRAFIRTVVYSGAGAILTPSVISCGGSDKVTAQDEDNLLVNGNFERRDPGIPDKPEGWEIGPRPAGISVKLTEDSVHENSRSVLEQRTVSEDYYHYLSQKLALNPGSMYRLRFYALGDQKASDFFAVCISGMGDEGPSWLYHPVHLKPDEWQLVDIIFRAQSGINPLHSADIEFRLNQWRPDFNWRPNRPRDRSVTQKLHIDSASLTEVKEGSRVPGRISRWMLVPGHDDLRMANIELGLGDGISMITGSARLLHNGRRMEKLDYLESISGPEQYAYSERSSRLYVYKNVIKDSFNFSYEAAIDLSGDAQLGISTLQKRALREGSGKAVRIPVNFEKKDFDRKNWPVTQGLPIPEGKLADLSSLRIMDSQGKEIPLQVRATSYWADDSIRWILMDFCINAAAGDIPSYMIEFGPGIKRSEVNRSLKITENRDFIEVDGGRLKIRASKNKFHLLEDLTVDGRTVLDAPAGFILSDGNEKKYSCSEIKPYHIALEEKGPLRAVIAVAGWNASGADDRFLTYTTRIHVYRDQPFVKVFHSITNRHEEQQKGNFKWARGWPDKSELNSREIPRQAISSASIILKPSGIDKWSFFTDKDVLSGNIGEEASVHRQLHHKEGIFTSPSEKIKTETVPGIIRLLGDSGSVNIALFRYANLFPKEMRISEEGLELGLIPFSTEDPHPLPQGTARTSEIFLSFDPPGENKGIQYAKCFTDPSIFSNPEWYCGSRGFMGDPLIPVNKLTIGSYDRIMESYMENVMEPYPKGIDDCGLMNYGDFTYRGYNEWLNLEYDGDLGLYMHFARSGNRRAFLRAMDGSRHFLDSDMGWYTGNFDTHGSNFPHNVAHYAPTRPGGHTYSLGLIHYYLLTGDRRGLEATRTTSDCINRTLYHRIHQYASAFTEDDPVGTKRGYIIPGGPQRSPNSRNTSDPSRYSVHSYLVTGEARFLDASISIAEGMVLGWPEVWRTDDDQYMHYRWPQVLGRLYDLTGAEHFRNILLKCGEWMMENPYTKYGEFRVSQCYGRGVQLSGQNNTRMMFLTAWAWKITGERKYLDWMINMFDFLIEKDRHKQISRTDGKPLGKEADNPARGAAWVVPNRTVLIDHEPGRFQLIPPGKGEWLITIGNTSETPLRGKLEIGPLPAGVKMRTTEEFSLGLQEEITLKFPVNFTEKVADGRIKVPYRISTMGTDGREGERNSFFAAHLLRPRKKASQIPELTFHAPLDNYDRAYSYGGSGKGIFEQKEFINGRLAKALGPGAEGWSFDLSGSIFPEAGTFSVWMKPVIDGEKEHGLLRILGHGWPFIGIFTSRIVACNQEYDYPFVARNNEWVHIAIRWDLEELAYFIDGKNVYKSRRLNYEIPTGELWGLSQESAAFDDLRIYSIPLDEQGIISLTRDGKNI